MKTLAELQSECAELSIPVPRSRRPNKEDYVSALREYHWRRERPREPLPPQIRPMLLGNWADLDPAEAGRIESDQHAWAAQPKLDGCRVLLHVGLDHVRITGRTISDVTYRLTEHQDNVPHLTAGLSAVRGTVLDSELVCPVDSIDTGNSVTAAALQAAVAILATTPENASQIQARQNTRLELHVFDVLEWRG